VPTVPNFNARRIPGVMKSEKDGRSDAELVARVRKGDSKALGELVAKYQRAAYSVALGVTGRHQDAEDAAQEAFLVALDRIDDCRDPRRFAGWLLTIVRNRSRNLIRRESLRAGDRIPASAQAANSSPARFAERAALREDLEAAFKFLPDVQREIVLLHDLEGWKHGEIAERLGIPSGTVRSHLHFARKTLRSHLQAWRSRVEAV